MYVEIGYGYTAVRSQPPVKALTVAPANVKVGTDRRPTAMRTTGTIFFKYGRRGHRKGEK